MFSKQKGTGKEPFKKASQMDEKSFSKRTIDSIKPFHEEDIISLDFEATTRNMTRQLTSKF